MASNVDSVPDELKSGQLVNPTENVPPVQDSSTVDSRTMTRQSKISQQTKDEVISENKTVPIETNKPSQQSENMTSSQPTTVVGPKPGQRTRQRTITVQSQLTNDITSAFNDVKQMTIEDPMGEVQRKIFAITSAKEKEWAAKLEKVAQLLLHEQRKAESFDQKATERLMARHEYEQLVSYLVEQIQQLKSGKCDGPGKHQQFGVPGPERNSFSDEVVLLTKERDQLLEDVNSLETTYGELFRRYEKLRQTSIELKGSEERMKNVADEMSKRYESLSEKFEMLRQNAEEQLDCANDEIDRLIKQNDLDTLALRMKVKHLESKITSLTANLDAKQKEIDNMTAMFEEVISKAEAS